jgi:hypothetical protein
MKKGQSRKMAKVGRDRDIETVFIQPQLFK